MDTAGNVYVADATNNMIREISPGGVVTTLAGQKTSGSINSTGTAASFYDPSGVAVDTSGNVYVADTGNQKIREISPGGVVTTLAGSGAVGANNSTGTAASFDGPAGVAIDFNGNVYVADKLNYEIRKITSGGVVSSLIGGYQANGVAVDTAGNVYIAAGFEDAIIKINAN